jgi:hypothetical protein
MLHPQLPGRHFDFVKSLRELQKGAVPFALHLGNDLPHCIGNFTGTQDFPAFQSGE